MDAFNALSLRSIKNRLSTFNPFSINTRPCYTYEGPPPLFYIHHPEGRKTSVRQPPSDQPLCNHELYPSAYPSLFTPVARQLQELPVELWLEIVQHAITPPHALDSECLPHSIEFYHTALTIHSFSNPAMRACGRTRTNLRLVCSTWKRVVDRIQEQENLEKYGNCTNFDSFGAGWLRTFATDQAARYGPCSRLDVRLTGLSRLRNIRRRYKHDVRVVRLQIEHMDDMDGWDINNTGSNDPREYYHYSTSESDVEEGNSDGDSRRQTEHIEHLKRAHSAPLDLTRLFAHPWSIQALHISLVIRSDYIPIQLLQGLVSLRTLSISVPGPLKFRLPSSTNIASFNLPSLTTLFVTIAEKDWYGDSDPAKADNPFFDFEDWTFPNLHTLSIDARGWMKIDELNETPPSPVDGDKSEGVSDNEPRQTEEGDGSTKEDKKVARKKNQGSDSKQEAKTATDTDEACTNLSPTKRPRRLHQPHRPTVGVYAFIRKHKDTLRSLRVLPFSTIDLADVESDLPHSEVADALIFPVLEAIATDFVRYSPSINMAAKPGVDNRPGTNMGWGIGIGWGPGGIGGTGDMPLQRLSLPNLRHLIHISTRTCSQEAFANSLLRSLQPSTEIKIATLTITEQPYMVRRTPYLEDKKGLKALRLLDRYCEENKVRVYAEMGMEVCCVQTAWKRMSQD